MRPVSPFHRFGASDECVAVTHGIKWEDYPGTNGETRIPTGKPLDAKFLVEGRASRWPDVLPADDPRIKYFSLPIAEKIAASGLTGIELHPVQLSFGDLRSLKKKADQCPGYMWARFTGVVLVDLYVKRQPWPLDPTGMFRLEEPRPGDYWDMKIREQQPLAKDFCRIVPGGTGYVAVSNRAAEFFDKLKLKEVRIGAFGNGYL